MFNSRYIALLEQQISDLRKQLAAKDATIDGLIMALRTPSPSPAVTVDVVEKAVLKAQAKQRPPVHNFLQSRARLEAASAAGLEVEPAEQNEKEATNG